MGNAQNRQADKETHGQTDYLVDGQMEKPLDGLKKENMDILFMDK